MLCTLTDNITHVINAINIGGSLGNNPIRRPPQTIKLSAHRIRHHFTTGAGVNYDWRKSNGSNI